MDLVYVALLQEHKLGRDRAGKARLPKAGRAPPEKTKGLVTPAGNNCINKRLSEVVTRG